MIAVKRLQSLFWILLLTLGGVATYLVTLRVATERNAVDRVRSEIARTRADIRYLETEFEARSNIRQLEKWNQEDYAFSAASADRYLSGERALAHLDGVQANGPRYVAPPVMVAMVQGADDLPSAAAPAASGPAVAEIRSAPEVIRTVEAVEARETKREATASRSIKLAKADGDRKADKQRPMKTESVPSSVVRKAERMAMLDSRLLDDGTVADIQRRAVAESRRGNR